METSWASQRSEKSRRRKTANIDGAGAGATAAVIESPAGVPGGRLAESLSGPRRHRDSLACEQLPLDLQAVLATAPRVPAVAADRAVRGDHPVARDQQADRVPADRATDRARRPRRADPARDLAVARPSSPRARPRRPPGRAGPRPVGPRDRTGRRAPVAGRPGAPRARRWRRSRCARRGSSSSAASASAAASAVTVSTGPEVRRATSASKSSSVVSQPTATTPRSVAATWNGPHGPGMVCVQRRVVIHVPSLPHGPRLIYS